MLLVQQAADAVTNTAQDIQDKVGEWVKNRPFLMVIASVLTVAGCCVVSQVLARYSKMCNIELNKYYLKKRYEKQKMMQQSIHQMMRKREEDNQSFLIEERGQARDIEESILSEDHNEP
jgi:uncharacterized membrane protein